MCGLTAILSRGGAWSPAALERATNTLSHRGPDGSGTWVGPGGRVGLGHTRLSVIGLENGAQPIASEDGRLYLAANGEFYGFESIRRDLENRGHVFATGTDSEIALHLYEEQGRGCVESLRGEFAFVLWDENLQTLWAVRDRFGIKPLYYAESGGVLYLASEVKALLAAGVPAAWDEETVSQQMFACFDAERTLFEGVRQVPPGHGLVAGDGNLNLERYWDVVYPGKSPGNSLGFKQLRRSSSSLSGGVDTPSYARRRAGGVLLEWRPGFIGTAWNSRAGHGKAESLHHLLRPRCLRRRTE